MVSTPFNEIQQGDSTLFNILAPLGDFRRDAILLARQAGGRNTGATKLATVIHTAMMLVQNSKFTVRHLP